MKERSSWLQIALLSIFIILLIIDMGISRTKTTSSAQPVVERDGSEPPLTVEECDELLVKVVRSNESSGVRADLARVAEVCYLSLVAKSLLSPSPPSTPSE